jgi:hypothetical protein
MNGERGNTGNDEPEHHVIVDAKHVRAQAGVDSSRFGAGHRSEESLARPRVLDVRHCRQFPTPPLAKLGCKALQSTITRLSVLRSDSRRS